MVQHCGLAIWAVPLPVSLGNTHTAAGIWWLHGAGRLKMSCLSHGRCCTLVIGWGVWAALHMASHPPGGWTGLLHSLVDPGFQKSKRRRYRLLKTQAPEFSQHHLGHILLAKASHKVRFEPEEKQFPPFERRNSNITLQKVCGHGEYNSLRFILVKSTSTCTLNLVDVALQSLLASRFSFYLFCPL